MTFPKFATKFYPGALPCPACDTMQVALDEKTGLCVECWRGAVLIPFATAQAIMEAKADPEQDTAS